MEQFYIALYNTNDPDKGYNLSIGGESWNVSEHTRQKMSIAHSGKNNGMYGACRSGEKAPFYGKHHTQKSKQLLREANIGKKHSEESKQKMRGKNNPMYGKTGKDDPTARTVICLTTKRIFFTIKEAAEYYNIKYPSSISGCCRNKTKTAGKLSNNTRLKWKYLNYKHHKKYKIKRT